MIRVLLLTASFGDGHQQVAKALKASFEKYNVTVHTVDCFKNTNKWIASFNTYAYELVTRFSPHIYGAVYRLTANFRTNNPLWKFLALFSKKSLKDCILKYQPDIVLQMFPDHSIELIQKSESKPFIGVIVTDYSVHSHWFHPIVDTYFICNKSMIPSMEKFTGSSSKCIDSGIPLRSDFYQYKSINNATPLNPYIVISTGGRGLFPQLGRVIEILLQNLQNIDIYIMCGRNARMYRYVERCFLYEPRVRGLAYVDNVAEWFRNALFAVVKSGGVTISECLACQCPMLFYRPQPGQEADNAHFLDRMGAGIVIRNNKALKTVIDKGRILDCIMSMKSACTELARPNAADIIVEHSMNTILNAIEKQGKTIQM